MTQTSAFGLHRLLHRVERDSGRIGPLGAGDDLGADPVAPGLQLLARGGAERVRGAQHHGAAVRDEHPGQLAAWWWSCPCR